MGVIFKVDDGDEVAIVENGTYRIELAGQTCVVRVSVPIATGGDVTPPEPEVVLSDAERRHEVEAEEPDQGGRFKVFTDDVDPTFRVDPEG